MSYCPQCLTEYPEGAVACADCGAALQPGLPAKGDAKAGSSEVNLVRLRTFSGPTAQLDADLARNILETQGILCALPGDSSAQILPGVDDVQLLVRKEDAEQAAEILQSYLDSPQAGDADPWSAPE